jgi:predicted GNAT family N-acyltransferase
MLKLCKVSSSDTDFSIVKDIRQSVFVMEQGVDPKMEHDGFESSCQHYLLKSAMDNIGVTRIRKTEFGLKLERFAILKEHRSKGYGKSLVEFVLADLKSVNVYLHAQIQVVGFYERLGFEVQGDQFVEAGIKHFKMVFKSEQSN